MSGRLYFVGQGGPSWRDPRNWAREEGGNPLLRLHARGQDRLILDHVDGHTLLDLRGMPNAGWELRGYTGKLRLPGGLRLSLANPSRWERLRELVRGRVVRPVVVGSFGPAVEAAGGWRRVVREGLAILTPTRSGLAVVPQFLGGAGPNYALVGSKGAVASSASGGSLSTLAWGAGENRTQNNLLICVVNGYGIATAPGAITGWTKIAGASASVTSTLYYKIAAGGDAAPTVPAVASTVLTGQLMEFSGNVVVSVQYESAGAASLTSPAVATAGSADVSVGCLIVVLAATLYASNHTHTAGAHTLNNGATASSTNNNASNVVNHYDFAHGITTGNGSADSDSYAFTTTLIDDEVNILVSFRPLITVQNTAALPYESLGGVQKTGAAPYEALRAIAGSAALPYEALLALAVAKALPYETLLGMAATGSTPYEALAGLTAAATDPYETVGEVAATSGVLPFEALLGLASNDGLDFEALAGLTAATGLPFDALEELAAVLGLPYATLLELATDIALDYETLAELVAVGVFPVESLEALTEDVSLPYETILIVLFPAGKAGTLTHARTGGISETLAGQISHSTTGLLTLVSKGRITKARHR